MVGGASGRLAAALVRLAALRWPADLRIDLRREWQAELHAIVTDPDAPSAERAIRALRFGLSLAVRRPATLPPPALSPVAVPVALPAAATLPDGRGARVRLVVAALGLAIAGPILALLLVSIPRLVQESTGEAYAYLFVGPTLVAVGALVGWRMGHHAAARATPAGPLTRSVAVSLGTAYAVAYVFGLAGEGLAAVAGAGIWLAGSVCTAWWLSRTGSRPVIRRVIAFLAGLCTVDIAVTTAIWLRFDAEEAARTSVLSWFPASFGYPEVGFTLIDFIEFFPHVALALTAFGLTYVLTVRPRR